MKLLANTCSVLFHPLFLLNFGLFAVLSYHPYFVSKFYDTQFYTLSLFIAINTLIVPLMSVYVLKRFKFIDDFRISNPKQRLMPYSIIAMLISFTIYQLYSSDLRGLPMVFLFATVLCVVINILINIKFTISSHTIASGGLIALFMYLTFFKHVSEFNWFLIISIVIGGLSGWSRLLLNAHDEKQVYYGYGVGFSAVLVMLLIFA